MEFGIRPLHSYGVAVKLLCAGHALRPHALDARRLPRVDIPQRVDEALVQRLEDDCGGRAHRDSQPVSYCGPLSCMHALDK